MTVVLGIDPDTHTTGIAVADEKRVYLAHCLEIDPDLKGTAAVVEMCKALWCAMGPLVARAGVRIDLVCVEGQRIYVGATPNPMSILYLGQVAGAALTAAMTYAVQPNVLFPYPSDWKGETSKEVCQARVYSGFLMPYQISKSRRHSDRYAYPTGPGLSGLTGAAFDTVARAHWKHVGDALALAHWAATRHVAAVARSERIADPTLNEELGRQGGVPPAAAPKRRRKSQR